MKSLISILDFLGLKSLWEWFKSLTENRKAKIDIKKEAIQEKANTTVLTQKNKQHRKRQVIPKSEIRAKVKTLRMKDRKKELINLCHNFIKAGATINDLVWREEKLIIQYTEKGVEKEIIF